MEAVVPATSKFVGELQMACQSEGCPVCRVLTQYEQRYWEGLLYEQVNDGGVRAALRAARGFCAVHTQAFAMLPGAPFAGAIITTDLLTTLLQLTQEGRRTSVPIWQQWLPWHMVAQKTALARRLRPRRPCPACEHMAQLAGQVVATLVRALEQEQFARAFNSSDGLCLPHMMQAISLPSLPPAAREELLVRQRTIWQRLADRLAAFVQQHDYRWGSAVGLEHDQVHWRHALTALSGARYGRDELVLIAAPNQSLLCARWRSPRS